MAIISTVVITCVFLRMAFSYTRIRKNRAYSHDKKPAPSIPSFKLLSKFLFVSSMLMTLTSFWISSPIQLRLYDSTFVSFIGVLMVLVGYVNLERAFKSLAENYSPLFDAYLPCQIVCAGAYRHIRHPIYSHNLFISFGLALASGSAWVLLNACIGAIFVLRAIQLEEEYLRESFSSYKKYSENTWRLIPFLF